MSNQMKMITGLVTIGKLRCVIYSTSQIIIFWVCKAFFNEITKRRGLIRLKPLNFKESYKL